MEKDKLQAILDTVECEGLSYSLENYTDVFTDSGDKKLIKLVKDYQKTVKEINKILEL